MSPSSSNFVTDLIFSMEFSRYFNTGILSLLWLVGLFLCLTRTDIPKAVRVLFGVSLCIWLFLLGMWIVVPYMLQRFVTSSGGDFERYFVILGYFNTFLRLIAGVLLLYVIFGPRQRVMSWEPGVMEADA